MKLLAWNLNHRAARRSIADWIASAIVAHSPDVVVLTEYVEGPDHERFLRALANGGLHHALISQRVERQNQVLIVSNQTLGRGTLQAPPTAPSRRMPLRPSLNQADCTWADSACLHSRQPIGR